MILNHYKPGSKHYKIKHLLKLNNWDSATIHFPSLTRIFFFKKSIKLLQENLVHKYILHLRAIHNDFSQTYILQSCLHICINRLGSGRQRSVQVIQVKVILNNVISVRQNKTFNNMMGSETKLSKNFFLQFYKSWQACAIFLCSSPAKHTLM